MRIDILGVGFDNLAPDQAVEEGLRLIHGGGSHYVVTPNPEIVEACRRDPAVMEAVNGADLVLADGIGVIYGAKILGTPLRGRVTGIAFAQKLMERMAQGGETLFLLGAKPGYAQQAAEMLREERPDCKMRIHLVDSHTYSMVFGWYLCECARKLRNGGELRDCILELESKLGRVEIGLAAYSLKQLKKSGRVSAAAAFAGELLGLRPIISLTDGVSHVEAKVRGDAAVIPAMLKWVSTRVDDMRDTPYMMAYTSSTQKRDELLKLCKKEFGHPPMHIFQLGGVVSANTGPDCIAIAFEGKPRRLADYEPPLP